MTAVAAPPPTHPRPFADPARRAAAIDAISQFPLTATTDWKQLAKRLQPAGVEDIEAVPEGVFETDDHRFSAIATVYVRWEDRIGGRDVSSVESLPAQVSGHFEPSKEPPVAVVDTMSVDASSVLE
ncbi:MAG: hypothetical protein ACREFY_09015 [Acetobacteraceae bacterium]